MEVHEKTARMNDLARQIPMGKPAPMDIVIPVSGYRAVSPVDWSPVRVGHSGL